MTSFLTTARQSFHQALIESGVLGVDRQGVPSNADKDQRTSVELAKGIIDRLSKGLPPSDRLKGQTSGKQFEAAVSDFLELTLDSLQEIRPATWLVENVGGSRGQYHLANYVPYRHLDELALAVKQNEALRTVLGNSYNISPDVLVLRQPITDAVINSNQPIVDNDHGRRSPLRSLNQAFPIVHAVVSCKWTLRSDRAQNARSEALGLLRNRKGRAPHIAVVTGEPSPSRIASLALGTGDIDTIYHFALSELIEATAASNNDEALSMLMTLVDGHRLRDIADLPLDLVV